MRFTKPTKESLMGVRTKRGGYRKECTRNLTHTKMMLEEADCKTFIPQYKMEGDKKECERVIDEVYGNEEY